MNTPSMSIAPPFRTVARAAADVFLTWTLKFKAALRRISLPARLGQEKPHAVAAGFYEGIGAQAEEYKIKAIIC